MDRPTKPFDASWTPPASAALSLKSIDITSQHGNEISLQPIPSRQQKVQDASSIPNGGLWAWLQVLGSFFLLFNSWYAKLTLLYTKLDPLTAHLTTNILVLQGHNQHLRLLPSLLHHHAPPARPPKFNLLDRLHPSFPPAHRWRTHRPVIRRRSFPASTHLRIGHARHGPNAAFAVYELLADPTRSSVLYRDWNGHVVCA
jgi:hypothetical protein